MNLERLYRLYQKKKSQGLSSEEMIQWNSYLQEDPEALHIVKTIYETPVPVNMVSDHEIEARWKSFRERIMMEEKNDFAQPPPHQRSYKALWYSMVAACIVVLAAIFLINREDDQKEPLTYVIHQRVLPDQSQVSLLGGSTYVIEDGYDEAHRQIKVTGDVYIEAAHDDVPMHVYSPAFHIMVKGTRFNIMDHASGNVSTICLFEGSIEVELPDGQIVLMTPGMHLAWDKDERIYAIRASTLDQPDWLDQQVIFQGATFKEVFEVLSSRYEVTFQGVETIEDMHYSDKIDKASLSQLIDRIERAGGIDIEQVGDRQYMVVHH